MADDADAREALLERAAAWAAQDPDEETRAGLEALVAGVRQGDAAAEADLRSRFDSRLAFGTAGLRGELGAGPNRMNRVLVAQAAAGLVAHLRESSAAPLVVIGYDGRKNSDVFARDTAEIVAGAGGRALLLPRALPTPVLAYAVRRLDADAGVMVTASHNPPRDNGYKVYLGGADGGSQIVPPADARIAARIERAAETSIDLLPRSREHGLVGEDVIDDYLAATAAVASLGADGGPAAVDLRVVYTAMHGVGGESALRVFRAAGLPEPTVVAEQFDPDPDFPTVAYPNPEEPGSLDLAFQTAREAAADLVIANDPDADRLAVAVPDPREPGGYRRLGGNEVGLLLGWVVARDADARGVHGSLAASLVSTPGLRAVAEAYGHAFVETLTGFKWISRAPDLLYGFEEALGYLVNPADVRDKDGLSAAVLVTALAARLHARGRSLAGLLDDFAERFGAYASEQVSFRVANAARAGELMDRLRAHPPESLAGAALARVEDLAEGGALPPSDVLRFVLEDGSRVTVRPSGTEPKLKAYVDARTRTGDARARAAELARAVRALLA